MKHIPEIVGILLEVVVGILDHLHVADAWIIWLLFFVGLGTVMFGLLRSEWVQKPINVSTRVRNAIIGMIPIVLGGVLFGLFLRRTEKPKTEPARESQAAAIAREGPKAITPATQTPQVDLSKPAKKSPTKKIPEIQQQSSGAHSPNIGNLTQGPGSIAQIGGTGNQATIIGEVSPPPRVLSAEQMNQLAAAASRHPFRVLILYTMGNEEAYHFSKQIGDALSAGGWTLKQPVTGAMILSESGGPSYGMILNWKGDRVPPGESVSLDPNTPWGTLGILLMRDFREDFYVQPAPGADADLVTLTVCANPKSKHLP